MTMMLLLKIPFASVAA